MHIKAGIWPLVRLPEKHIEGPNARGTKGPAMTIFNLNVAGQTDQTGQDMISLKT